MPTHLRNLEMNDKDNVTPITPDIPDIEGYKRIEGQYTGAADAVHRVLKDHGFDDQAKNRGWIELTIVARFSDEGAMFHTVQAKGIAMGLAAPGLTLLRMMALANDLPRDYFVLIATVNELNILDKELHSITPEQANEPGLTADVAAAELGAGRWTRALELYGRMIEGDPDNRDALAAYREILLGHAPRVELSHYTLLQETAIHHVEEAAWRGWLADQWWLRAGVRYGSYHQRRVRGTDGAVSQAAFSEQIETALATVGFQPTPRWTLWAGLEESARREEIFRTTGRVGAGYDDGKATLLALEIAVRELLTNPVAAIPRNGTTDRVTVDVARRVLVPVVLAAHYDFRHYRVSGEDLGDRWEAAARAELELVRSRVQVTLIPQVFFSEYTPIAGSPLRDTVSFLRREDIIGIGAVVGWDVTSALRLQAGSVGRRDLHRALTSWEATGEARWRIRPWLEGRVLYTRNTESTTIGGQEESFLGRLDILY